MRGLLTTGVAATASLAGLALCCWRGLPFKLQLALALRASPGGVLLRGVQVPVPLISDPTLQALADEEGLASLDVGLARGVVAGVWPAGEAPVAWLWTWEFSMEGAILTQCFSDPHTHLIKTHAGPRCRNSTGSINGALQAEVDDRPCWQTTPGDVQARMNFALRTAWHHGTAAIRTHLDGTSLDMPEDLRAEVYRQFDKARHHWGERGMQMQGVANLYLPIWKSPAASQHAAEASRHPGVVLGAYCGDVSSSPPEDVRSAFASLLGRAQEHAMDVDLHIDETNNPECCAVELLCDSLRDARDLGYQGHVALSHVNSLALQDPDTQNSVIQRLAGLGPLTVICCPNTNVYLQDRRGTMPPIGKAIPPDVARTPIWRGLTLIQELREAGVAVAAASDNVRDWWYRFGDYDCLALLAHAINILHLDTAPSEGAWFDLVTRSPASLMGVPSRHGLRPGCPADLILFPAARRMSELLARPQLTSRVVLRHGGVQFTRLPLFSELDPFVSAKTRRSQAEGEVVQRGGTRT